MNIVDATAFLERLKTRTDKKSEIKIYNNFIGILSDLENRELSSIQLQLIENELDNIDLKAEAKNQKRYLSKKLESFKAFLKNELSLISEGYYSALGISLGMTFGAAFGVVFDKSVGITYGVSLGLILGLIIGKMLDSHAEKQNRVLKVKKM
ncbi:MAG: hypothetical protein QM503_01850 [Bacteroidota bacterium]